MDLIIKNANIVTMDKALPRTKAIAIQDGIIHIVGDNEEVLSYKKEQTEIIDLKGKFMLPGFNDSHMHLLGYGLSLLMADLEGATTVDKMLNKVKSYMQEHPQDTTTWIRGRGWNEHSFPTKRLPTKYDLDQISTEHPIALTRICGHVIVVNSKALVLAGIDSDTPQVTGGHFDIDENGEPLGIFRENAMQLIVKHLPEPTVEDFKEAIIRSSKQAITHGITSVQSDDFQGMPDYQKVLAAFTALQKEEKMLVRVNEQSYLPTIERLKDFIKEGYQTGTGDDFFKIGPLKLLTDGSLGARTAYLSQPYADDSSTRGIAVYTQEELDELVVTAHVNSMQIALHAIGDEAMQMVLNSIEKAYTHLPKQAPRHSIIHAQITDHGLLDRMKKLNVIAHIQPLFVSTDLHFVEERIGKERAKTSYQWKTMIDKGIHVACGSDCPIETLDVLQGIYAATTRKDLNGYPSDGWVPEEKLSVYEAVHGYTLGAAYASFEENRKGSITVGKLADLVVLSDNIFEIEADSIKDVKVEMTFVDGKLVYQKH